MRSRLAVACGAVGATLWLSACAPLLPVGLAAGGLGAGLALVGNVISIADTADKDTDTVLAAVKPLNEQICAHEIAQPHSPGLQAGIEAFCANLPDDPLELLRQAVEIIKAVKAEKSAASSEGSTP
jgi:hypothetical protein